MGIVIPRNVITRPEARAPEHPAPTANRWAQTKEAMDRPGEQLTLAMAFLDEARRALDRVLRAGSVRAEPGWRQQHLEAMTYWARAYRHYRRCHAAQKRVTLGNAS
jgi:hypothetical protein